MHCERCYPRFARLWQSDGINMSKKVYLQRGKRREVTRFYQICLKTWSLDG